MDLRDTLAISDARRIAKRAPADYRLRDYNRWYVYLVLVLLQIPVGIGWSMYVRSGIIQAFRMVSDGMMPTIRPGERILANKLAYQWEPVQRGVDSRRRIGRLFGGSDRAHRRSAACRNSPSAAK